jgi:HPt (histidine-containing phosphotransfer) domain-containing protein
MAPNPDPFEGTLDLSVMDQLLNLDVGAVGLLKEMYGLFREDTPDRIKAIEMLLGSGDPSDLGDLAHAIKGAAGTMGAVRLRAVAAELEGGARKADFPVAPVLLLEQLKEAYAESLKALDAFIAERESV